MLRSDLAQHATVLEKTLFSSVATELTSPVLSQGLCVSSSRVLGTYWKEHVVEVCGLRR